MRSTFVCDKTSATRFPNRTYVAKLQQVDTDEQKTFREALLCCYQTQHTGEGASHAPSQIKGRTSWPARVAYARRIDQRRERIKDTPCTTPYIARAVSAYNIKLCRYSVPMLQVMLVVTDT
jgi:hypothetical protein